MVKASEPRPSRREDACMIEHAGRTFCIDPLEDTLQLISRRWVLLVVGVLGNHRAVRFSEAKRTIPGISARALSTALSDLQAHGLARRDVDADRSPPAVTYALTPEGSRMRTALIPLIEWAQQTKPRRKRAAPKRVRRDPGPTGRSA